MIIDNFLCGILQTEEKNKKINLSCNEDGFISPKSYSFGLGKNKKFKANKALIQF